MKNNKYVVVIGEPRCGMTSLLKKISGGKWNGRSDTLCTVEFDIPDIDEDLTLKLVELDKYTKGQKPMTDMYTNMAHVVVIIKDCSTSDNSEKMLHHIDRVHCLRPTVPIVLVTTKCDEGPLRKSDDGYSLFSHISTSCKTDLGLADLKKALFRAAFPTEMRESERWYNMIKNWEGFRGIFCRRRSSARTTKTITGGIQKKTANPVIGRNSLDYSSNRQLLKPTAASTRLASSYRRASLM